MSSNTIFKERIDSKNKIYSLNLHRGKEAFDLLSNRRFQNSWDNLYINCPWATVFQHRYFISSWYRTYQEKFHPIIITEQYEDTVIGMVHLAVPLKELKKKSRIKILGAGEFDSEYQVWLTKENNNSFITNALNLLLTEFPKCKVIFRYLPPNTPLSWIESHKWKKKVILQASKRPLMDTYHPEFPNLLRKRHLKAKYNRINKAGNLKLEEIKDPKAFSELLNFLRDQYDFRQGALFNKNQFREDPNKALFLKELFEANILHVSVLKLNDEITASIISMTDKNWVHMAGLISHSPFHSKYSPGLVQLYMLGRKFYFEHIEVFDLTPGNDPYKDRLATHHDLAYELVITKNKSFKCKRAARKSFFDGLYNYGILPQKFKLQFEKTVYLIKNKYQYFLFSWIWSLIKGSFSSSKPKQIKVTTVQSINKVPTPFRINHLGDLLNYKQQKSTLTRWEFLEDALKRFENGQISYSISKDQELQFCAWVITPSNKKNESKTDLSSKVIINQYFINDKSMENLFLTDLYQRIQITFKTDQIVINN
ncbi:GNAT family N-acetyltransferase [Echinicola salinicaeni]|uniref:GNAT family N-acetyltransferase n=1 Tax=Echinicola salinicaeni TaxID=2762757 RepID=UPI0016459AF0|nr:GNAT family N-acetyltransferase [Echinicola salinicaeni]